MQFGFLNGIICLLILYFSKCAQFQMQHPALAKSTPFMYVCMFKFATKNNLQ